MKRTCRTFFFMHAAVAACLSCVATVRAETIDLADVIDGETEYVVTDLSGNDSYTYGGAETVDLVFNLSAAADYSGTISGNIRLVKRGSGSLALRSANSYTGGTKIEEGAIGISDPGALGEEAVDIVATKNTSAPSYLRIDAAMTFANDINVSGGLATSKTPSETAATFRGYASIYVNVNATVEFSGDITATCDLYLWDVSSSGKTRTFSGRVSADGYAINAAPYSSTYVFGGGIKASVFYASYLSSHMGQVKFQTTAVEIGRVAIKYTKVWTQGVLNDDVHIYPYGSADKNRTHFTLYADETIGKWTTASSASTEAVYPIQCNPTATDRCLTLKASENGTSYGTLMHKVSLVYDPQSSSCTQTVTCTAQRTHTTSGSITVNRGTFKVSGKVSMPNLQGIFVADGAAFVADTAGTTPFTSLTNITVGAGATFFCAGDTTAPFSEGVTKLTIGEGASVTLPAGETFSVTELWKGGKRLSGGTYTPDGADGTKALPELKQGAVYVPTFAGDTQTLTWTGATGPDIDTAANWQENEKPDWDSAGAELVFAADGSTSTYAEFGSAATAKKIVFRQPLGFTLGAAAGGSLRLLEGVEFGDTGDVAPTNTVDVPVEIVGDQTWSLPADPGSVFTLSKPLVSDENAAVGTLTMTSAVGTLNFFTTNSTYTGNLVAQAKTINIRGENALGLADKDGTVSLTLNHNSNTAKCWFRGCSIDQPLTCTMNISGSNYAIFDCAANTTNIFNGFVYAPKWTQFDAGSYTVFNGGARFYAYTRQRLYSGATIVFRDRLALTSDGGSHTFAPVVMDDGDPRPRIVVECPAEMSKSAYYFQIDGGIDLDVRYDRAFSQGCLYLRGKMLLNGNTQRFSSFETSSGTVSSTNAPAFLELNLAANAAQTNSLRFTDLAGFKMVGSGFVRLNGVSTTSGTLAVDDGTVEMGAATWLNASNVVVSGEGELRLTRGSTFDRRKTTLSFVDGGKIYVPDGVTLAFASATVTTGGETVEVPADVYDSSNPGPFAGHLSGGGAVRVGKPGALLMLR